MSITLNNSDFQCLQDQLVDLKTKNYELAEKNRRSQADFEAAKAKICSLQLKLEEQERDFQVTSTTLRRELEATMKGNNAGKLEDESESGDKDGDYKTKYKKLLHKAKEIQQRYDKSLAVIQQMDEKINGLTFETTQLEEENKRLSHDLKEKQQKISKIEDDRNNYITEALDDYKRTEGSECSKHLQDLESIRKERDTLELLVETLRVEIRDYSAKVDNLTEERKIQEKKSSQMIKQLKRQLTSEKSRNEALQKRLESFLSGHSANGPNFSSSSDLDNKTNLSTSSNCDKRERRGGDSIEGNNNIHCDDNSVSSWSLVARARTSTPSICSIESADHETIQLPARGNDLSDTTSQVSQQHSPSSKSASRLDLVFSPSSNSPGVNKNSSSTSLSQNSIGIDLDSNRQRSSIPFGLKFEDQAALIERVTRLQHDKWTLEEKLSYMEQSNATLTQELANKSQIVRQYFMDQAMKSTANHNPSQSNATSMIHGPNMIGDGQNASSRRVSFPNNFNQLIADKPSIKKMVEFLKDRGQTSPINEASETITREATKKMQLMLEETLIKCLKLQENLDLVTKELNKLKV